MKNKEKMKTLIKSIVEHNKELMRYLDDDEVENRAGAYVLITGINEEFYKYFEYLGSLNGSQQRKETIDRVISELNPDYIESQLDSIDKEESNFSEMGIPPMVKDSSKEMPEA